MRKFFLQITLLLIAFNINAGIEGVITIPTEKLNTLKGKEVGIVKSMKKKSKTEGELRYIEQKYFSGLVYLFDPRSFEEIVDKKGFQPKIETGIDNPIFVDELKASYSGLSPSFDFDKNIIASSKHITLEPISEWDKLEYQFMIDTKAGNISGLNIDNSETTIRKTFEVDFQYPIPLCCIIGYFQKGTTDTFYKNEKYTGYFSWDVINIDSNYKELSFPTRKQRLFNFLHRLCYP